MAWLMQYWKRAKYISPACSANQHIDVWEAKEPSDVHFGGFLGNTKRLER